MTPKPPQRPSPAPAPGDKHPSGASSGPARKGGVDRAMALRDVMQHVVEVEKENARRPTSTPSHARTTLLTIVCVALLVLSVYSWVARPEFIWGPRTHEASAPQRVANARSEIFLLSRRIEAYRAANGAYPRTLSAVGHAAAGTGITYTLVSETLYRLTAHGPAGDVTYQSDQPADQFVGNSMRMLGGGVPHR